MIYTASDFFNPAEKPINHNAGPVTAAVYRHHCKNVQMDISTGKHMKPESVIASLGRSAENNHRNKAGPLLSMGNTLQGKQPGNQATSGQTT